MTGATRIGLTGFIGLSHTDVSRLFSTQLAALNLLSSLPMGVAQSRKCSIEECRNVG
jgi:hypothetical protein